MTYHIYTGYKWREMTAPELEILTPERIVPEMTDDAQAGDIFKFAKIAECSICGKDILKNDEYLDYEYWGRNETAHIHCTYSKKEVEG